ncbi:Chemotaxis protein CheW [Planctomycetes bacterium Poly30]|uniref:Chemotaxis protein CheW n=1 Tax=Saltatorellus ferox TaxID=2528018 RepID=A0A518EK99_9BACT|nr:Chemotaxis protein CheW [Planctomycetes bacterium Poly30]
MTTQVANPPTRDDAGSKYLTFVLDGGVYGIPILNVREIIAIQPVTPLPRMPMAIRGVINLRGKIIPVLGLRTSLGLHAGDIDRSTCIVVLEVEDADQLTVNIGCIVNAVREVSGVRREDVQDPPSVGARLDSDYILGLAKAADSDHVITLLNMQVVLAEFMTEASSFESMEMEL